jgi:hypothetical protein
MDFDLDLDDPTETSSDSTDILAWTKEFLSDKYSNNPKRFLEEYRRCYDDEKEKLFQLPLSEFKEKLSVLSDNFYEFLALDWQNILVELVAKRSVYVFDFVLFLNQKALLPQNLEDCFAFKEYQNLLDDKDVLKEFAKKGELSNRLKIKTTESENWECLENADKEFYMLKTECASYVRSVGDIKEINTIEISSGVVKTKGLEYKSPLPFDEIIYYEA